MRKLTLTLVAVLFFFSASYADEGMWMLKELNRESVERMKELGFTFPIDKMYDDYMNDRVYDTVRKNAKEIVKSHTFYQ